MPVILHNRLFVVGKIRRRESATISGTVKDGDENGLSRRLTVLRDSDKIPSDSPWPRGLLPQTGTVYGARSSTSGAFSITTTADPGETFSIMVHGEDGENDEIIKGIVPRPA